MEISIIFSEDGRTLEMRGVGNNISMGTILIDTFIKTNIEMYNIIVIKNNLNNYGFGDN